ncbi:MAG: hypothetical protein IJU70_04790 [Lentisphaeria bacterium]|nr:hypothetical protein [Lentisphaeria bacterium]
MKSAEKKIAAVAENFDFPEFQNMAYSLLDIEKRSSYDDFEKSSQFCYDKLKALGFSDVKRYAHKADGVSGSFDCVMPQAWSLDRKKRSFLEVVGDDIPGCGRVLADSSLRPLAANIWSPPTPKGGITAELIAHDSLPPDNWEAARGKWVLYTPREGSRLEIITRKFAAAGIAGLVAGDLATQVEMPDDLEWYNGNGHCGWYLTRDDVRFPVFSITPRQAVVLLRELKKRRIVLHGEMNTRVYDGEIWSVTGTIPGESSDEIALFAHIYEPFIGDDAAGFAHLAEFGHQLLKRGVKPRRTLRVVYSMELYGFAAYLKAHGQKVVLAANFDGVAYKNSPDMLVRRAPFFCPSFSDWLNLDFLTANIRNYSVSAEKASMSDDTFGSDPYFHGGVPVFWLHSSSGKAHHSMGYLFEPDWLAVEEQLPVVDALLEELLCVEKLPDYAPRAVREFRAAAKAVMRDESLSGFEKRMRIESEYMRQFRRLLSVTRFTGQAVETKTLEAAYAAAAEKAASLPAGELSEAEAEAASMFVKAGNYGCPFSLGRIPHSVRRPVRMPRLVWALLDGRRSLLECIRMADAETGRPTSVEKIAKIVADIEYVSQYGYASVKKRKGKRHA